MTERIVLISADQGVAALDAERSAQVNAPLRQALIDASLARRITVRASSVGGSFLQVPMPGAGGGTGRLGPHFGTPGGDSLVAQLGQFLFRTLRLRASLALLSSFAALRVRGKTAIASTSTVGFSTLGAKSKVALTATLSKVTLGALGRLASTSTLGFKKLRPLTRLSLGSLLGFKTLQGKTAVRSACAVGATAIRFQLLAAKDCAVAIPVACLNAGANLNGAILTVDGSVTTPKVSYVAFNLAGLPVGGTVTAATLIVVPVNTSITGQNIELSPLADADEGWDEPTIVCSNRPTPAAAIQTFNPGIAGVDVPVPLNASWLARLSARCGLGMCSMVLQNASGNLLTTGFYDRENSSTECLRLQLAVQLP